MATGSNIRPILEVSSKEICTSVDAVINPYDVCPISRNEPNLTTPVMIFGLRVVDWVVMLNPARKVMEKLEIEHPRRSRDNYSISRYLSGWWREPE